MTAKKDYDSLNEACVSLRVQIDSKKDKKVRFNDKDDILIIPTTQNSHGNQKKKEVEKETVQINQS